MKLKTSPYTKLFWNEYQLNHLRNDYNIVFNQHISGSLDIKQLTYSLVLLIRENHLLNSHLIEIEDNLYWHKNSNINKLEVFHNDKQEEFVNQAFNLEAGPLYRFGLFKLAENEYDFIIVLHHAVIDGNAFNQLIDFISDYYNGSKDPLINKLKINAIININNLMNEKVNCLRNDKTAEFWQRALLYCEPKVELPYQKTAQSGVGEYRFSLDCGLLYKDKLLETKSNLFRYLISCYGYLLSRYTNNRNIHIAYPVGIKESNDLSYAAQINTVVLPISINYDESITKLINRTNQHIDNYTLDNGHNYAYFPTSEIIANSTIKQLNVAFAKTNLKDKVLEFTGCQITTNRRYNIDIAGSELLLEYEENNHQIEFRCRYDKKLFTDQFIVQFCNHYQNLVQILIEGSNYDQQLAQLPLLAQEEYQTIVYDWNNTDKDYPKDKTIHQLFEEQVQRTPDNIAVVFEEQTLTYQELNHRANQLAHKIRSSYNEQTRQPLQPDTLIALCLDRSLEMIVAILATLKAGAAYVPLDPEYPDDRISYILDDTNTALVLTQSQHLEKLSRLTTASQASLMDIGDYANYQNEPNTTPETNTKSNNLAYVIYTSGTTGIPKGVMIEHDNLHNFLQYKKQFITQADIFASFINYTFDAINTEIYPALLNGNVLHLLSNKIRTNLAGFYDYLILNDITLLVLPSAIALELSNYDLSISQLRVLIVGGETFIGHRFQNIKYLNQYGPTESTVCATLHKYVSGDLNTNIGKPLDNIKIYVLDCTHTPVPVGVIGELYIAGAGLARGYLNNPELTAERFIPNPFATERDITKCYTRMYKTGDLVRWLPDGNLEYIGRNDFQVKIRGFRIELGEIEEQLMRIAGVKQACVIARTKADTNQQYLAAYYVLDQAPADHQGHYEPDSEPVYLNKETILDKLSLTLPDYMRPSTLMELAALPLTINGKLDRQALPEAEFIDGNNYLAPTTEMERTLVQIWSTILGIDINKLGIRDDFFRIGGNSILAIKLTHQMGKALGKHISVADIFKHKTIHGLLSYLESNDQEHAAIKIVPVSLDKYPLSFAQERLWFIEQYEGGTNAYHIPMLLEVNQVADIDILKQSLLAIVKRHEVLRSTFIQHSDGNYYQRADNSELISASLIRDYSYNNHQQSELDSPLNLDINTPFNLSKDYPIRICFYQIENSNSDNKAQQALLLINIHHIASDGWSTDILLKEINAYYAYFSGINKQLNLPQLSIQYKDFAYWQKNYLSGEKLQEQLDYWHSQLAGYEPLSLPTDKLRPKEIDYSGANLSFSLNPELSAKLRKLAKEQSCSLYSVLLSGFYVLLSRYSNQEDIVIGTPIANRHYAQIEDLIGLFVNSLALRAHINPETTANELIKQIQHDLTEAQRHQDLPFEQLVNYLNVEKDHSRHPIFQVMFGVQSFGNQQTTQIAHNKNDKTTQEPLLIPATSNQNNYQVVKFDLECFMDDGQTSITGSLNYATALYTHATIERMISHYQLVLEQLANQTSKVLKDYNLLSQTEYQTIVYDWNNTDKDYPKDKTILQLFEEQVAKTPDNIAVVFEEQSLTYNELNQRANQLAHKIRNSYLEQSNQELLADTLIALYLDRSLEMIIAILATLKAGAAYVPLDPEYPDDRISYILDDTNTALVLTQSQHIEKLSQFTTASQASLMDVSDYASYQNESHAAIETDTKSNKLAYVIYTSGTTGRPKGAPITHRLLANRLLWQQEQYEFSFTDKVLQKTPYVFDVSVWELLLPIISGSILVFAKVNGHKDPEYLYDLLSNQQISKLHFVPSMLDSFLLYLEDKDLSEVRTNLVTVNAVLCSGEALQLNHVQRFKKLLPQVKLHNLYGPTEVAIDVCSYDDIQEDTKLVHIGKPISNIKLYVLDNSLTPAPVGVYGELYIGAFDLEHGYLNNPELTAERFIPNPFATAGDIAKGYTRMYKTGDLVRWLPDGNLEYIGRNDFQVKIRGFRIELGEIEEQLVRISGIKQACVIAKTKTDTNQQYLAAYYVLDQESIALTKETILDKLSLVLPDYMLPSSLMELVALPLTINGKLDRRALPEAEFVASDNYLAPTTELEQTLVQVWSGVLGIETDKLGIRDDFFRVGGDSILSIQLSSRLRKAGYNLSVRDIFDQRNIASLAKYLEQQADSTGHTIISESGILSGELGLLPIQSWFFDKVARGDFSKAHHWNQSFLVKVPKLNLERLKAAITKLLMQHDVLRISYSYYGASGEYQQNYNGLTGIVIPKLAYLDVSNKSSAEISTELTNLQSNFNLSSGPLWQIAYLDGYSDDSARVYFALHHLIVDAVSWRILIEDLEQLLVPSLNQQSATVTELAAKGSSYRQWVAEIQNYSTKYAAEANYWNSVIDALPDYSTYTNFAKANKDEEQRVTQNHAEFTLSPELTNVLLQQANQAYHSEINDLLLTALAYTLKDWNNRTIQGITLEGHGREDINPQLNINHTVGWFTSMYPVKLELADNLSESIKQIKEELRNIPHKGIGFGSFAQNPAYDLSFSQLPAISFNYLGQFDNKNNIESNENHTKQQSTNQNYWQISSESSGISMAGENKDHNLININGMVLDGKLGFSIVSYLDSNTTQQLADSFKAQLEQLIQYCQELVVKNLTCNTISDFITTEYTVKSFCSINDKTQLTPSQKRYFNLDSVNLRDNMVYGLFKLDPTIKASMSMLYEFVHYMRKKHLYFNLVLNNSQFIINTGKISDSILIEELFCSNAQDISDTIIQYYRHNINLNNLIILFLISLPNGQQYVWLEFPHFIGDRRALNVVANSLDKFLSGIYSEYTDYNYIIKWLFEINNTFTSESNYKEVINGISCSWLNNKDKVVWAKMSNESITISDYRATAVEKMQNVSELISNILNLAKHIFQVKEDIIFNYLLNGIPERAPELVSAFILLATYEPILIPHDIVIDNELIYNKIKNAFYNQHKFIKFLNSGYFSRNDISNFTPKILFNVIFNETENNEYKNIQPFKIEAINNNLNNVSQYLLSFSIIIRDSTVTLDISYAKNIIRKEDIETLIEQFASSLGANKQ